jgi:hypothetical protein
MGACGSTAGKEPFGDGLASGRRVAVVTMDMIPTGHGRAPTVDSRITRRPASRVCAWPAMCAPGRSGGPPPRLALWRPGRCAVSRRCCE